MYLSVVIIARNEERTIARCIESVIGNIAGLDAEIILVDSGSTDRTIEIARKYPVTVVQIESAPMRSPSSGRYVGTLHSKGEFVLFVDSDVIVVDKWVACALPYFKDETLGGVAGKFYRVFPGEPLEFRHPDAHPIGPATTLPGSGAVLYRKKALDKAGTFNPFVKGEEERELGYRILRSGYSLLRVDLPMGFHLDKVKDTGEIDEKAGYFTGVGQIVRRYGMASISREVLASQAETLAFDAGILAVLFFLAVLLATKLFLFFLVTLGGLGIMGLLLIARKGWMKVYLFFRSRILILVNLVRGLLMGIRDEREYEVSVKVILPDRKLSPGSSGS